MMEKGTINDEGIQPERDTEVDIVKASEIAREWIRTNIGNLLLHQFKIESIQENGDNTKYIVICSIVPDIGQEREYYVIKVNILNGAIVSPIGRGKKDASGKIVLENIKLDSEWKK